MKLLKKSIFLLISSYSIVFGQSDNKLSTTSSIDSLKFKSIQESLTGCWKTKVSQFKYDKEKNFGMEYQSRTHSSAPIFSLKIKENEIYIEWIELLGGEYLQKIKKIKKNRLIVINEEGRKFIYRRNKKCL